MASFIQSGRVADLAIIILVAETIALVLWTRRRGMQLPSGLVSNAVSGVCLLLALRAALTGSGAVTIAVWLAAGFVGHLVDVVTRLRPR